MSDADLDDLITPGQAARLMKCSIASIYRWCLSGRLPFVKRVGRRLIRRTDLLALLVPGEPRRKEQTPAPEPTRRAAEAETMRILERAGLAKYLRT